MKECNYKHGEIKKDKKTFLGVVLLFIGIVLLGKNLHFIPYNVSHILLSWQMLLIVIGILMIAARGKSVGGLFMIGMGSIFMWDKFFPFSHFQWQIAWPLVFIFVGTMLVIIYLGNSIKQIIGSKPSKPKINKKKTRHSDIEFDIDKIEPIED